MTFHDFPSHKTMVVMRGKRRLAVARYYQNARVWLCRADGFCWIDWTPPHDNYRNHINSAFHHMKRVRSKKEARDLLQAVDH